MSAFNVRAGLHVEEVDATLLVLDPTSSQVFELTDEQVEAFRQAQAGTDLIPDRLTTAMAGLVELGLVTAPGWDRRRVLLTGGAVAAAAVVALALPSPAAAQSAPGGDGPGGSGPTTTTAPANQPPVASIIASGTEGPAPHYVFFFGAESSDPDGTIVNYSWDFGDGSPQAMGPTVLGTYRTPGSYTATLTVTDNQGATATATAIVTVS